MKSHEFDVAPKDLWVLIVGPLAPVALFALSMHLGAALNVFPNPRPTLDTDRTILFHQADASRSQQKADLLLIGDSSCLMDVSANQLEKSIDSAHRVLNLGTLSYLDLNVYASFLRNYVRANPRQLRAVVLLMHPDALRQAAPSEYHLAALQHFYAATDFPDPAASPLLRLLGSEVFKGRFWSRAIPAPLSGDYGREYGFTSDLWRRLSEQQGSAIDPKRFVRSTTQGDAEYRLAKSLEKASQAFRSALPPDVKLLVGITPVPAGFVNPGHRQRYEAMLQEWNQWLRADSVLSELPATLPDEWFAGTTHLNKTGQQRYTELLSASLKSHLQTP